MKRLVLASSLILLAACGGTSGDPSGSASGASPTAAPDGAAAPPGGGSTTVPDPCSVLDADEIAEVIGHEVGPGTPNPAYTVVDDTNRVCGYDAVLVIVDVGAGYDRFKDLAELGVQEQGGDPVEPVPGIGEEAYWDPNFWQMGAREGDLFVGVAFIEPAENATLLGWGKELLTRMLEEV